MRLPSVIALKEYVPAARRPAFTRFNVFLRDRFCCQYCGDDFATNELTFDHVIPKSRGGRTAWTNVVTACRPCNLLKGNHLLREAGLPLQRYPSEPTTFELQENGRGFPPGYLHESWRDFLYWDSELEQGDLEPGRQPDRQPRAGLDGACQRLVGRRLLGAGGEAVSRCSISSARNFSMVERSSASSSPSAAAWCA